MILKQLLLIIAKNSRIINRKIYLKLIEIVFLVMKPMKKEMVGLKSLNHFLLLNIKIDQNFMHYLLVFVIVTFLGKNFM